jgi:hypothetical protein
VVTVTSATVKAGPGSGIIYLKPAATAAGKVRIEGRTDITGAANITGLTTMSGAAAVTGTLVATGDITGTAFFYKNNTFKHHNIHRLVAMTFLPNIENKKYVDHIDNN